MHNLWTQLPVLRTRCRELSPSSNCPKNVFNHIFKSYYHCPSNWYANFSFPYNRIRCHLSLKLMLLNKIKLNYYCYLYRLFCDSTHTIRQQPTQQKPNIIWHDIVPLNNSAEVKWWNNIVIVNCNNSSSLTLRYSGICSNKGYGIP